MDKLEMTGKTVEEAVEIALLELDAAREEVAVEVVSRGKTGLFGLRSEPAKVRVTRLADSGSVAAQGLGVLSRLFGAMGVDAYPTIRSEGDGENWPVIDVAGEDSGLLIGKRGETLRALQFVVNMVLGRQVQGDSHLVSDVERYRERRAKSVEALAARVAEQVVGTGRSVTLEAMSPAERRVVHMTLSDHPGVTTQSEGFGEGRRVTVMPREV